jgi:hypothetical protein
MNSTARARQSQRRGRATTRTIAALIAMIVLALLTAACGGSSSSSVARLRTSTTSGGSSARSTYAQALAFAKCVRTHGVALWPDPESSGQFEKSGLTPRQLGTSSSQIATAERACRSLLPTYSTTPASDVLGPALRFSRCMRAHGATNFPDPLSNGAIRIPHAMENSPAYLTALHFCIHKYGVPPPPSSAGGGGP